MKRNKNINKNIEINNKYKINYKNGVLKSIKTNIDIDSDNNSLILPEIFNNKRINIKCKTNKQNKKYTNNNSEKIKKINDFNKN